jgi:hypothetical protein
MYRLFGCLLSALLFTSPAWAQGPISGFMLEKGTHDFAVSVATDHFDTYVFGEEERAQSLTTQSLSLYYEYGLSSKASLVFTAPYLCIDETNAGLQDGSLFVKIRNRHTQTTVGHLNFITALGITTPLSGYTTDTNTPIGNGAFSFQGRYGVQYNSNDGYFIQLQSGLDFRLLETLQTSMPVLLRTGFGARHYFVEGWLEWFNTFSNGVDQNISGRTGSDWWRVGGSFYVPVYSGLGIVGGYAKIFAGKNIGLSSRFHAGLVYRLKNID